MYSSYLLPVGVGIILLRIVFRIVTERRRNASAKLLGCVPAPLANPDAIIGFKLMRSALKAFTNRTLPDFYVRCLDTPGAGINTVRMKLPVNEILITRDERNVKAVLSSQVEDWRLGVLRKDAVQKFTGINVFTLEGQPWRHSRSLVRSAFSRETVANLAMYERHVQDLFLRLPVKTEGWTETVDLQTMFFRLTLDVITELLYGYSVHGQNPQKRLQLANEIGVTNLPDADHFIASLDQVGEYIGFAALFGKWHNFAPMVGFYSMRRSIRKYSDWYVRRRLDQISRSKQGDQLVADERFILLNELSNGIKDPILLRNQTISLIAAGRGTTAGLISWVIYHLARNPAVFDKLRDVVLSEFGYTFDVRRTGFAELRNCKYLQYCVNEALRIGSPQHSTTREASKDTTLPVGGGPDGKAPIFVPEGTTIILQFFGMHHRPDMWGEDVMQFRPERWEERKIDWGFSPFGGGPRKCAGGEFQSKIISLFTPKGSSTDMNIL